MKERSDTLAGVKRTTRISTYNIDCCESVCCTICCSLLDGNSKHQSRRTVYIAESEGRGVRP